MPIFMLSFGIILRKFPAGTILDFFLCIAG